MPSKRGEVFDKKDLAPLISCPRFFSMLAHPARAHLTGVTVLDFGRLLPGPFCSMLLADMGAHVIKVEDPRGGDYARYHPPLLESGEGAFFGALNRNKLSLTLDLKHPDARGLIARMIPDVDVVLETFRPGVMERLGCDHATLSAINPGLITCAITGFGQDGPMSGRAGHDIGYLALSGLLEQTGLSPASAPVIPGFQVADLAGGALYGALGITAALYARTQHGEGAFIDISMSEGALSLHAPEHARQRAGSVEARGEGLLTGGVPCYGVYETADKQWIAVGALEPKFWLEFIALLGLEHLGSDSLDTGERGEAVRAQVAEVLKSRTRQQWTEVFGQHDVCCEPVCSPREALEHQLFKSREMFFMLQGVTYTRTPLSAITHQGTPAPGLGQHTDAVLSQWCDADEIAQLRAAGVIG